MIRRAAKVRVDAEARRRSLPEVLQLASGSAGGRRILGILGRQEVRPGSGKPGRRRAAIAFRSCSAEWQKRVRGFAFDIPGQPSSFNLITLFAAIVPAMTVHRNMRAEGHMEELDCQACGACCTHAGEVVVEAADPRIPQHLTRSVRGRIGFGSWEVDEGTRIMARRDCNSCAALSVRKGRHICRVYDRRPAACREFPAGSAECLAARERAGMPGETSAAKKALSEPA
jgi:Fe-S-cluster containining protein